MTFQPRPLKKIERLKLFFTHLKNPETKFDNVFRAHQYLQMLFLQIELLHIAQGEDTMVFPVLSVFKQSTEGIHSWQANSHTVLIHENGAYGIYFLQTVAKHEDPIEPYKSQKPLVHAENTLGQYLW